MKPKEILLLMEEVTKKLQIVQIGNFVYTPNFTLDWHPDGTLAKAVFTYEDHDLRK